MLRRAVAVGTDHVSAAPQRQVRKPRLRAGCVAPSEARVSPLAVYTPFLSPGLKALPCGPQTHTPGPLGAPHLLPLEQGRNPWPDRPWTGGTRWMEPPQQAEAAHRCPPGPVASAPLSSPLQHVAPLRLGQAFLGSPQGVRPTHLGPRRVGHLACGKRPRASGEQAPGQGDEGPQGLPPASAGDQQCQVGDRVPPCKPWASLVPAPDLASLLQAPVPPVGPRCPGPEGDMGRD